MGANSFVFWRHCHGDSDSGDGSQVGLAIRNMSDYGNFDCKKIKSFGSLASAKRICSSEDLVSIKFRALDRRIDKGIYDDKNVG